MFFSPFSIAITSLGEERVNLSAFRTFVRFALVLFCLFPLPFGVWEGLRLVIVANPGLFLLLFYMKSIALQWRQNSRYILVHMTATHMHIFAIIILQMASVYVHVKCTFCHLMFYLSFILREDVEAAVKALKLGKSPGLDNIPARFFLYINNFTIIYTNTYFKISLLVFCTDPEMK